MWALGCLRWRNPLTSVLFYPLSLRGGCSRALLTSPSSRGLALFSIFFFSTGDWCQRPANNGRTSSWVFSPRPRSLQCNNGGRNFSPWRYIYSAWRHKHILRTRMLGDWVLWRPLCSSRPEAAMKTRQNRVVTIQRYMFKGNYFHCIHMKEAYTSQAHLH